MQSHYGLLFFLKGAKTLLHSIFTFWFLLVLIVPCTEFLSPPPSSTIFWIRGRSYTKCLGNGPRSVLQQIPSGEYVWQSNPFWHNPPSVTQQSSGPKCSRHATLVALNIRESRPGSQLGERTCWLAAPKNRFVNEPNSLGVSRKTRLQKRDLSCMDKPYARDNTLRHVRWTLLLLLLLPTLFYLSPLLFHSYLVKPWKFFLSLNYLRLTQTFLSMLLFTA